VEHQPSSTAAAVTDPAGRQVRCGPAAGGRYTRDRGGSTRGSRHISQRDLRLTGATPTRVRSR
jgi:hypothetical protein